MKKLHRELMRTPLKAESHEMPGKHLNVDICLCTHKCQEMSVCAPPACENGINRHYVLGLGSVGEDDRSLEAS